MSKLMANTTLMSVFIVLMVLCMFVDLSESQSKSPVCQLYEAKQQQLNDVMNAMGENGLILKSLGALTPNTVYTKKQIDDEIILLTDTIKELSTIKSKIGMYVDGLKNLCSNGGGVSVTPVAPISASPTTTVMSMATMATSQPILVNPTILKEEGDAYIIGEGLKSCKEYRNELSDAAKSGLYWIKPNPQAEKFIVYCDQTISGGGWTLVSTRSKKDLKYANIVKPDFSGNSLSDEKWASIRAVSTELLWKDSNSGFALATIASLSTSGACKPLSNKLTDSILFHREDNGCTMSGMDYCLLGATGNRSPEIHRLCSNHPYKVYQFNDDAKGAKYLKESNVLVR